MITKKNNRKIRRTKKKINYRKKKLTNKRTGGSMRGVKKFFGLNTSSRQRDHNVKIEDDVVKIKCNDTDKFELEYDNETQPDYMDEGIKKFPIDYYLSYDKDSYECKRKVYYAEPSTDILRKENGDIIAMRIGNKGPMYPYEKESNDKSAKFTLTIDNHKSMTISIGDNSYSLPRLNNDRPVYVLSKIKVGGDYQPVMELNKKLFPMRKLYSVKSLRQMTVKKNGDGDDDDQFNYTYKFLGNNNNIKENIIKEKIIKEKIIKNILDGKAQKDGNTINPLYSTESQQRKSSTPTPPAPNQVYQTRIYPPEDVYLDVAPNTCLLQYRKLIDELSNQNMTEEAQKKLLKISRKVVNIDSNTPNEQKFREQNKCTNPIILPEEFKLHRRINKNGNTEVEEYKTGRFKEPNPTDKKDDDRKISICCPDDFNINSIHRPGYKLIYTQHPEDYGYDILQQVRINLRAAQKPINPTSSSDKKLTSSSHIKPRSGLTPVVPQPVDYYDPKRNSVDYTALPLPNYFDRAPRNRNYFDTVPSSSPEYMSVLRKLPLEAEVPYFIPRDEAPVDYVEVSPSGRRNNSSP